VNDPTDTTLSRYLDGELADAERTAFERALSRDPELRARLERQERLQALAASLPATAGHFDADDVRVRLGSRRAPASRRRIAIAAAAVLLLGLSHAGAFLLGAGRDGPPPAGSTAAQRELQPYSPLDTISEAEGLFERAARLDPARQPSDELRGQMASIQDDFARARLPDRLAGILRRDDVPRPLYERAGQLLDGWTLVEEAARTYSDPGLRGLLVTRVARDLREGPTRLRALPASTESWVRATSLGDGRVSVRIVEFDAQGRPRVTEETGTIEELRARNVDVRLVSGD